jgi:ABC-2 type transport system ATP-binding protein
MRVLELERVRKTYDRYLAVDDLSIGIEEGQIFGLLGPNGAGKTSAIRMMIGIIMPDAGVVRMFGEPFARRHLRRVGYLPEERGLYRRVKVIDHLLFLAELNGMSRGTALAAAQRWAERLEIGAWLERKVEELSKGMQQKVQFMATILHDPRFVIMDEPFAGLDPHSSALLMEILIDLRRNGHTILFSTHRMDQVERLCDAICLIDHGRSVLNGELGVIKSRFGKRNVQIAYEGDAGFLDHNPLIAARIDYGNYVEVRLASGADAQELLRAAAASARVTRFELMEPSLEQIFLAVVDADRYTVVGDRDEVVFNRHVVCNDWR